MLLVMLHAYSGAITKLQDPTHQSQRCEQRTPALQAQLLAAGVQQLQVGLEHPEGQPAVQGRSPQEQVLGLALLAAAGRGSRQVHQRPPAGPQQLQVAAAPGSIVAAGRAAGKGTPAVLQRRRLGRSTRVAAAQRMGYKQLAVAAGSMGIGQQRGPFC